MTHNSFRPLLVSALVMVALARCDEFEVPITAEPTRHVESALLGDWLMVDEGGHPRNYSKDRVRIRPYDQSTYVVNHNDALYRAWHSDVDGLPLITLQSIDSDERKYQYWTWRVSDDGSEMTLRSIGAVSKSSGLIPTDARDSATIVDIIRKNRESAQLFGGPVRFSK